MDSPVAAINNNDQSTLKKYLAHNPWLQPHAAMFKSKATSLAQQGIIWRERDDSVEGPGGAPFIYWTSDLDAIANELRAHAEKVAKKQAAIKNAPAHYLQVAGLSPQTAAEMTQQRVIAPAPAPKETQPAPVVKTKPAKEVRYAVMVDNGRFAVVQIKKRGLYLVAHFQSETAASDYVEWKNLTTN